MPQSRTFEPHIPSTPPSPMTQTPSEHLPNSVDSNPPGPDPSDVGLPVATGPTTIPKPKKPVYKCRDHSDSDSEEEEEDDPDILRPNCRGRWFTCLGADYGPRDHRWYGIHPRLGMRYGQLDENQQKLYEAIGPDYEHEEPTLAFLEKAKTEGLEGVSVETFKGMMVPGNTADEWTLGVRHCEMGPSTYSHARNHLLGSMHAPIGYRCPVQKCPITTKQEWDMKRHLRTKHKYKGPKAPLQEMINQIRAHQQPALSRDVPQSALDLNLSGERPPSGPVVIGNHNTVQINPPTAHSATQPRQHNTGHHARPAPYHLNARPVRVPSHSALPQPLPQNQPDNLGYAPPVYAPPAPSFYDPPFIQLPPAPIWAPQRQLTRSIVAPDEHSEVYGSMHNPPNPPFMPANQVPNGNYGSQPFASDNEYFNMFSQGILPTSRSGTYMHQPFVMGPGYAGMATNPVQYPGIMYPSAPQPAGYPMCAPQIRPLSTVLFPPASSRYCCMTTGSQSKKGHGHLSPVPEVHNALAQEGRLFALIEDTPALCSHTIDTNAMIPDIPITPIDVSPPSHSHSDTEATPTVTPYQLSSPALSPAQSASTLSETYRQALLQAQEASLDLEKDYSAFLDNLSELLMELQAQGHSPQRPASQRMEPFFKGTPLPVRTTGKGSKGGMKYHDCCWPGCNLQTTLQKCIDHFFSKHVKVKFFPCSIKDCDRAFTRKFDLDKHLSKIHGIERPRAAARAAVGGSKGDNRSAPY
ncbi:SubName: Full=Uncharacterized protein {ECO:0000313/EMBL:CCA69702.1} [Serendipita indica DSM 11827]|nr:SubName: Full=Uncharacterized protein {ECO:0000313/EMBL:CCA69702.1} [Serendipita indica DSM 11827]